VKTQSREKSLRGSQTQEFHYSEDKARYKIVTLTCTDVVVVPCSLTCNPTQMLPNQVTYLKGSSIESFTLGPTPKIDFSLQLSTLVKRLQRDWWLLWALMEFTSNSCSSQCLGASIYRLRCRMGDCSVMYGRHPDGEPWPSERTTMWQDFSKILLKIFPVWEPRPDGETLTSGRLHVGCK
jgi:hypothetical protein